MIMRHKSKTKKTDNDRKDNKVTVGLRLTDEEFKRLEAVAERGRWKIATAVKICFEDHLPVIEERLGLKK